MFYKMQIIVCHY